MIFSLMIWTKSSARESAKVVCKYTSRVWLHAGQEFINVGLSRWIFIQNQQLSLHYTYQISHAEYLKTLKHLLSLVSCIHQIFRSFINQLCRGNCP